MTVQLHVHELFEGGDFSQRHRQPAAHAERPAQHVEVTQQVLDPLRLRRLFQFDLVRLVGLPPVGLQGVADCSAISGDRLVEPEFVPGVSLESFELSGKKFTSPSTNCSAAMRT